MRHEDLWRTLRTARMHRHATTKKHLRAWHKGDDHGLGYAVGRPTDDVNMIRGLGRLVEEAYTDSDIAIYRTPAGTLIGVGDANGPWAVDLDAWL